MNRTKIANAGQTCGSSSQLETKNVQHVPAQSCSGGIGALTAMRGYGLYGLVTSDSNVDGDCRREIVERLHSGNGNVTVIHGRRLHSGNGMVTHGRRLHSGSGSGIRTDGQAII